MYGVSLTHRSSILRKETEHADVINPEQKPRKRKRLCTYRPCLNLSTATGRWLLLSKSLRNELQPLMDNLWLSVVGQEKKSRSEQSFPFHLKIFVFSLSDGVRKIVNEKNSIIISRIHNHIFFYYTHFEITGGPCNLIGSN